MPEQRQIFVGQTEAAPLDYTLSPSVELILKAVHATFTDNGAAGDWLPCVELVSDSDHVIARAVDQGVKVTAGDDADVSWFPGVKHAAAAASGLTNLSVAFGRVNPSSAPVIAAGATTTIVWDSVTVVGPGITFSSGSPRQVTIDDGGTILVALNVAPDTDWPNAAAGYIQISHLYNLVEQILMQTIYAAHPGVDGFAPVGSSPGNLCSFAFLSNNTKGANPAHWQAQIKNTTAASFTLGIDTSFALARVSPWVNF